MPRISRLAERLLAFQVGLCCMEIIGWLVDKPESSNHEIPEQNHEVWGDIRMDSRWNYKCATALLLDMG